MATPISRPLSILVLLDYLSLATGRRASVDGTVGDLIREHVSDETGDCQARLVRRQGYESARAYVDTICTCMKEGCEEGRSSGRKVIYAPAKIRDIVYHDKGVDCTASEFSSMCGLDAPIQKAPSQDEQCRAKLAERVSSDFPDQICGCIKEGCDGEIYTPAKIRDIVLHDKGVDCTTSEYSSMCGLDAPIQKAPSRSEQCRAKLAERVDSDFPNQICECMKDGCDGETYTPAQVRSFVMEDKSVDCSEGEYRDMCGLGTPGQEAPSLGEQCVAKLAQRVDSDFPKQICECMKEGCDGETYTPASIRGIVLQDKGVDCSEGEYRAMCGL